jgi:hypothetical protein
MSASFEELTFQEPTTTFQEPATFVPIMPAKPKKAPNPRPLDVTEQDGRRLVFCGQGQQDDPILV